MSPDFKRAFRMVWLVATLVTASAALAPFALEEETIARVTPVCESKRLRGTECWMCGTTTAFVAISRGDWAGAARANRGAVPLFGAFLVNAGVAAVFLVRGPR